MNIPSLLQAEPLRGSSVVSDPSSIAHPSSSSDSPSSSSSSSSIGSPSPTSGSSSSSSSSLAASGSTLGRRPAPSSSSEPRPKRQRRSRRHVSLSPQPSDDGSASFDSDDSRYIEDSKSLSPIVSSSNTSHAWIHRSKQKSMNVSLFHNRQSHQGLVGLRKLAKKMNLTLTGRLKHCISCAQGKANRAPFFQI